LSHSEISGSLPVSGSPELFAAVHVLHRLSSPRHPPCALGSLTLAPKARIELVPGVRTTNPRSDRRTRSGTAKTCIASRPPGDQWSTRTSEQRNRLRLDALFSCQRTDAAARASCRVAQRPLDRTFRIQDPEELDGLYAQGDEPVELIGFEPTTSGLQSPRSPS
jgi:hypothetical protein